MKSLWTEARPAGALRPAGWRWGLTALLLGALAGVVACGGGVEVGGTGDASTYAEGSISGFGSIVVNGVHYDESAATIVNEDGLVLAAGDLRLGMVVRVDGGAIDSGTLTATAQKVTVAPDLLGPVQSTDAALGRFTVLGQTVRINSDTAWAEALSGGVSALAAGQVVVVHAVYDAAAGTYLARRVELPTGAVTAYFVRGAVGAVEEGAKTFTLGAGTFRYVSAPAGLAAGALLRLKLETVADASGRWLVTTAGAGRTRPADGRKVELEGVVSALSGASRFTLAGQVVDIASARVSPSGTVLAAGMRVEVEGAMASGVLVATRLEVRDADDDGEDDDPRAVEIEGRISALDAVAQTLVVRGVTVHYGQASFSSGKPADLKLNGRIEVRGRWAGDGVTLVAEQVKLED
ncbi:DUF5666 domain-containing protein [Ideonella livida]|uniref:DUF5666 domain-containing protein n=1 Tax=Ideonella livida TaxID=2707176 RepID=A0A7C9PGS6_9BURK|nr:DUF5666 domain-containing protein [Ideonella livida]NDY91557.1 hypothetical protein [Ideonella livida]